MREIVCVAALAKVLAIALAVVDTSAVEECCFESRCVGADEVFDLPGNDQTFWGGYGLYMCECVTM